MTTSTPITPSNEPPESSRNSNRPSLVLTGMGLGSMLGGMVKWIPGTPPWAHWLAMGMGAVVGGVLGAACELAFSEVQKERESEAASPPSPLSPEAADVRS